jgi:hypothetical protein
MPVLDRLDRGRPNFGFTAFYEVQRTRADGSPAMPLRVHSA